MKYQLKIHADVFARFPDYKALVLYVSDLRNAENHPASLELLRSAEAYARASLDPQTLSNHPHIAAWRAAYSAFGAKPSKYLCSAEALIKRTLKGADLPSINMIVDVYNAVSLRHQVPVGGEDWDQLASDLELRCATGTEPFITRQAGEELTEYPDRGEVIWCDTVGVTCRRWNYRQCERTAVTSSTRNAYFVLDGLPPYTDEHLMIAGDELAQALERFSQGCDIERVLLTPKSCTPA